MSPSSNCSMKNFIFNHLTIGNFKNGINIITAISPQGGALAVEIFVSEPINPAKACGRLMRKLFYLQYFYN